MAFWVTFILTQVQTWNTDLRWNTANEDISLNQFLKLYQENQFETVKVVDAKTLEWYKTVTLTGSENQSPFMALRSTESNTKTKIYKTNKPIDTSLSELGIILTWASWQNVSSVEVIYNEKSLWTSLIFESLLPLILMIWAFFLLMKFLNPKWWSGLPFVGSAGKLTDQKQIKTRFKDVIWMEEVKEELKEVVDYLKNPGKYSIVWARVPKWILLHGEPWSWKTLLARAVAWEAWVPFFSASWPEFIEMFVWAGTLKVRDLFKRAKAAGKAIIFIDEIDSIWGKRWNGPSWAHREQENMLNQILTEMDGFEKDTSIIVIAATNRPDILDPALLRSWRFDRKVRVGRPTTDEREDLFKYYLEKKKMEIGLDLHSLALRTSGLVGADIENIVNEASIKIAKDTRTELTREDFEYALEKVIMWPEKKIKTLRQHEREVITYHELWHAITAHVLPNGDPVEKISIVSRWMALWVTWKVPEEEKHLYSKAKFKDEMVTLLGWRAAEEIYFGKDEITTWASNDFQRATQIASDMVLKYWMDEELWTVTYHDNSNDDVYYGQTRWYSEKTAELADKKIKDLLSDAYKQALEIIKTNKDLMDKMWAVLLEKEYINKLEFEAIIANPDFADELLQNAKNLKVENEIANSKKEKAEKRSVKKVVKKKSI